MFRLIDSRFKTSLNRLIADPSWYMEKSPINPVSKKLLFDYGTIKILQYPGI
jgi:hypothetical protein